MTLLTVIQDAYDELGLKSTSVSTVYDSSDAQILQMFRLLKKECNELLQEHDWQGLITVAEITTVATVEQTGLLPSDFQRMVDTRAMWNDTSKWEIVGPVSPQERRTAEVWDFNAIPQYWWIRGNELHIFDTTAGDTVSFEYISDKYIYQGESVTPATTFAGDDDTFAFPEELLTRAVVWRFKQAKGMEYAEELTDYSNLKSREITNDKGGPAVITTSPEGDRTKASLRTWPGQISTS